MFLGWQRFPLVLEHGQCNDNPGTGLSGVYDIVYVSPAGGYVRVGEVVVVFGKGQIQQAYHALFFIHGCLRTLDLLARRLAGWRGG